LTLDLRPQCPRCEDLRQVAIAACEAYHILVGALEVAHIRHDTDMTFRIQQQAAEALGNRNLAIGELSQHEMTHAKESKRFSRVAAVGG
jgi:hypothetical protein